MRFLIILVTGVAFGSATDSPSPIATAVLRSLRADTSALAHIQVDSVRPALVIERPYENSGWQFGFLFHWPRISQFALATRLPTLCEFRPMARSGCLLSYGPALDEITERSAVQIDRILRGTPPGELPIERPTRFELAVNLKTANALGVTVPQSILLRADEVIQ